MPRIRIGIDVGGTFTHAVAINDSNLKLIGQVKVKTTHTDKMGVARGVIDSLKILIRRNRISPHNISLIAHSTTQATNALLEGDVAPVGVIAIGSGVSGFFVRLATRFSSIKLWNEKEIKVWHRFFNIKKGGGKGEGGGIGTGKGIGIDHSKVTDIVLKLKALGAKALVIAEAFSTDDSDNEKEVADIALRLGIPCTATSDISGLYGLRARTKTAIINASVLPKMIDAAEMTEKAIRTLKINAPIMVVRSDGGVLSLNEMKKRPILTILSGPAAGVGAALFHEKMSDGIFLEVGGTSTDISVIKDGVSQIRPAVLGRHRIHLKTLDVKTLGIAGGSMPRFRKNKLKDVGPRSAHIAGIDYSAFSKIKNPKRLQIKYIQPQPGDPADYLSLAEKKRSYTLTPTCAANYLKLVEKNDWAYGSFINVKRAFEVIGATVGINPAQLAENILDISCAKLEKAVKEFIKEYGLEPQNVRLVGGGGGAAALVPYLSKKMDLKYKPAKDQAVISAIGAAMSMLHEEVERSIPDPSEEDVLRVKQEAENRIALMGAVPGTIQVNVQVDKQRNIVRASAFGGLKMERRKSKTLNVEMLKRILIKGGFDKKGLVLRGKVGKTSIFQGFRDKEYLFIRKRESWTYVLDEQGMIQRAITDATCKMSNSKAVIRDISRILESSKKYGDAGAILPKIMVVLPNKIVDLSTISDLNLMKAVVELEVKQKSVTDKAAILTV